MLKCPGYLGIFKAAILVACNRYLFKERVNIVKIPLLSPLTMPLALNADPWRQIHVAHDAEVRKIPTALSTLSL